MSEHGECAPVWSVGHSRQYNGTRSQYNVKMYARDKANQIYDEEGILGLANVASIHPVK
jgi:hypothetical protein